MRSLPLPYRTEWPPKSVSTDVLLYRLGASVQPPKILLDEPTTFVVARPRSGHELLQGAAKDAALKARFKPTLVNGKPAKATGAMTYNFVLDEKEKT